MKDRKLAIKKVEAFAENPDIIKEPTIEEMADLVVMVLGAIEEIDGLIKAGRLDGKTPESDKDYMSYETAQNLLRKEIQNFLNRGESVLSETATELDKRVQQAIKNIRNGENGIITDADIAKASQMALEMIELPDFDSLVDEKMTSNPIAIRDGLESIVAEEDKLKIEAISNLRKELDGLKSLSNNSSSGGVRLLRYLSDVNIEGITNGQTILWNSTTNRFEPGSGGAASAFTDLTDVPSSYTSQALKVVRVNAGATGLEFATVAGTGDVVGPASATDNAVTRFDTTTGKLIQNSVMTLNDAGTNQTLLPTAADPTFNITLPSDVASTYSVNPTGLTTGGFIYRFFRTTNTSGTVGVAILQGNNTTNIQHLFSGNTSSYVQALSGNFGVGVTVPTAALHLKAGTATASTAPLKFNAGTVLTAAEAGTMEFTNSETGLTFTAVATRRQVVLDTATQTLTNKRISARLGSTTSSATPTINTDNVDIYSLTAQAVDITSFTTNLTGTPTHGQSLIIEITGTAARAITWGASFEASTVALPTTTVTTAMLTVGFKWNSTTSKWRCLAAA